MDSSSGRQVPLADASIVDPSRPRTSDSSAVFVREFRPVSNGEPVVTSSMVAIPTVVALATGFHSDARVR